MRALFLLPLLAALAACGGPDLGPPDGWESSADGSRWWRAGTDTTGLFPDHATFESMGIERRVEGPRHRNVQMRLINLYRHNPELVDSVFTVAAEPYLSGSGNQVPLDDAVAEATRRIHQVYRSPRQSPDVKLGREVPYVYPDSLAGVEGAVEIQAFLTTADGGAPVALKVTESVHPALDALALQAATQMRYFRGGALGVYRPGFVYFRVPYPSGYKAPPAPAMADSTASS